MEIENTGMHTPVGYSTFWLQRIFKQHQTFPLYDMSTVVMISKASVC